jgi:hypothetical protein
VFRGITDPNPNIQFWMGNREADTGIPILEPTITGGVFFSAGYQAIRTDTTFLGQIIEDAFGGDGARMKNMIFGSVDSIVGSFLPTAPVGTPVDVDLPFTPDTVVFFSPQEDRAGVSSQAVQGATGWGWCTEDDQALLIYGGHWNPPNPFQAAGYMSSSRCWVANCLDRETMGSVGTDVAMGTAVVTPTGFTYTKTEDAADAGETWPVLYWALAPVVDGPQFFRRVGG